MRKIFKFLSIVLAVLFFLSATGITNASGELTYKVIIKSRFNFHHIVKWKNTKMEVGFFFQGFMPTTYPSGEKGVYWSLGDDIHRPNRMFLFKVNYLESKIEPDPVYIGMPRSFDAISFTPSLDEHYYYSYASDDTIGESYHFLIFDLQKGQVVARIKIPFSYVSLPKEYRRARYFVVPVKGGAVLFFDIKRKGDTKNIFGTDIYHFDNSGHLIWKQSTPNIRFRVFNRNGDIISGFCRYNDDLKHLYRFTYNADTNKITIDKTVPIDNEWKIYTYSNLTLANLDPEIAGKYYIIYHIDKKTGEIKDTHIAVLSITENNGKKTGKFVSVADLPDGIDTGRAIYACYGVIAVIKSTGILWHDISVYIYNPVKKKLIHFVKKHNGSLEYLLADGAAFYKGNFYFGYFNKLYTYNMKTGKTTKIMEFGDMDTYHASDIDSIDYRNGIIIFSLLNLKEKKEGKVYWDDYLIKVIPDNGFVTVKGNVKGKYEILKDGKLIKTALFGDRCELPPGTYTIKFPDIKGLKTPDSRTIEVVSDKGTVITVQYKDIEPPKILPDALKEPNKDNGVYTFTVTGDVYDNFSGIKSVTVNGIQANVNKNRFTTQVSFDKPGTVSFKIVATDNAGNTSVKTLSYYIKTVIEIKLWPGEPYMYVNGVPEEIDPGRGTTPVIKNNRTLVPIRAVVEALGGTIEWKPENREVDIKLNDKTVTLWIGKHIAKAGWMYVPIDKDPKVVPEIINGRTMLPLRFVAESLGCTVNWDPVTRTITITYEH